MHLCQWWNWALAKDQSSLLVRPACLFCCLASYIYAWDEVSKSSFFCETVKGEHITLCTFVCYCLPSSSLFGPLYVVQAGFYLHKETQSIHHVHKGGKEGDCVSITISEPWYTALTPYRFMHTAWYCVYVALVSNFSNAVEVLAADYYLETWFSTLHSCLATKGESIAFNLTLSLYNHIYSLIRSRTNSAVPPSIARWRKQSEFQIRHTTFGMESIQLFRSTKLCTSIFIESWKLFFTRKPN